MFRQLIRNNRIFLYPWLIIAIAAVVWVLFNKKGDGVIWINGWHSDFADQFFIYATKIAEEWGAYLVVLLLVLFKEVRHLAGFALVVLATLSIVYLLKHYVFPDAARPISVLGAKGLNLVENMRINTDHSFPSGHTTAAFAFFAFLAFSFRQRGVKVAAFVLALLAGISRVYLVQHFVQDVIAGSFLGILIAVLIYRFFTNLEGVRRRRIMKMKLLG